MDSQISFSIQSALTYTIEAIAFIAIIGLPVHYIITNHVKEVQSWGTPHAIPAPEVTQTIPTSKAVEKPFKPRKTRKTTIPKPMSLGAAAIDYSVMSSEQLRKQCALQNIDWRKGGDSGKAMKKGQMLAALR